MHTEDEKTILLVEDEALIAISEERILKRHGYKVITALSGEEAVEICATTAGIDLVLMDINLGAGMDGTQAAVIILRRHDIPLIFLSSHTEREVVEKTEGITSYGYIVKNSGEVVLIASIKMAFRLFDARMKEREKDAALRESEERFSLAMEATRDCLWDWKIDSGEVYSSPGYARMLGYTNEDVPPNISSLMGLIHPDDRAAAVKSMMDCVDNLCDAFRVEFRMQARSGAWRWILGRGKAVERDRNGRASRMIGTHVDITERKLAEEALRENREILQLFIEHAPAALAMFDRQMRCLAVSRRWIADFGLEGREIIGQYHYETFPEIPDHWKEVHRRSLAGEVVQSEGECFRRVDGSAQWLQWAVHPWRTADGSIGGIVIFSEDITERKLTEDALRSANERLELAESAAGIGVWDWDITTGHIQWTPELFALFGLDPAREPAGFEAWRRALHPDDLQAASDRIDQAVSEGTPLDSEYRVLLPDGTMRWINVRGKCIYDPAGRPLRMLGICIDITRRRQAEEALQKLSRRLAYHVDNSPLAVIEWGPDMRIIRRSTAAERLFGWKADEVLGKRMEEFRLMHEEDAPHIAEVSRDLQTGSNPRRISANRNYRKDGSVACCEWYNSSLVDESGTLRSILSLVLDVTERTRAEEELQRAYEEKRCLLMELQHRAKNSFSLITSLIDLMESSSSSHEVKAALHEIGSRVMAISILYDLLATTDAVTMVRLDEYFERIASSLPGITARIKLHQDCDAVSLPVKVAVPLGIIITELVTNAVKYAFPHGRHGTVTLSVRKTDAGAAVEVSDDGVGLPEGFDLSSCDTLGLKLVTILARQINGKFAIDGRQGTRCVLEFPLG